MAWHTPEERLEERDRMLLRDKRMGLSNTELAKKYDLSVARVCQIWARSGEVWRGEKDDR